MVCGWVGKKSSTDLQEIIFKWNPFKLKNSYEKQGEEHEAVSVFILFQRTYIVGESYDKPD